MPYFRFVVEDGSPIPQPEPIELRNVGEAKSHAVILAGQMLKDVDGKFWNNSHWTISVTTPEGLVIATIDIDGATSPIAS